MHVQWQLTNKCNFKCSYCPEEVHSGSLLSLGDEVIKNFANILTLKLKNIRIEFTGGEPTSYSNFIELCKIIKNNDAKILLTTNGSKPLEWWKENSYLFDYINISYHLEFSKHSFIKNVLKICPKAHINVMALPSKFDQALSIAKDFSKYTTVALQPIVEEFNVINGNKSLVKYTDEQLKILQNQSEFLINSNLYYLNYINRDAVNLLANKENKFTGWHCNIGKDYFTIDPKGFIHKAWCQEDYICNIFDVCFDDIDLKSIIKDGVVCNKSVCHCYSDMVVEKRRLNVV